ncbi:unnamed protein product [Sphagnum troendelagicum]|uniref:Uncharacterized protein n=1 Tax=Sphagnum troendelagicum TaxID=128251 RepID=A0ABP0UQA5_9BRYO
MAEVEAKAPEEKVADVPAAAESSVEATGGEVATPLTEDTTTPNEESKDAVPVNTEETPGAATEAVPPESETKPEETSGANFWQKLKTRFLKAKEVPVKEESQPAVVEPASVPEAKPEKKESKPGIISKVKKSFWKTSEAKSAEPVAAPVEGVEKAEKAPETGESSAPPTEEVSTEPVVTEPVSSEAAPVEATPPEKAPEPVEATPPEKAPEPVEATASEPASTKPAHKAPFTAFFQKVVKRITNKSPPKEATSAPAEGATSAPAEEATSAPAEETPAAPAEETPAAPAEETPAAPAEETPSAPAEETASAPAEKPASAPVSEPPAAST